MAYYRTYLLPWDSSTETEQAFRAILRRAGIAMLVLSLLLSLLPLPERDPAERQAVPPRLARLLLEKPQPPPPPPERVHARRTAAGHLDHHAADRHPAAGPRPRP